MLDPERLSSLDDFGDRIKIIPAEVQGFYRRHRTWSQWILLVFFLALPWTKIHGQQSLLLDVVARKFAIFGIVFWAHDAPMIFYILGIITVGLAFVTSVWGRVWCGWACPQTIFIDAIFRRIEIFVQGKYIARRQLDQGPLTLSKVLKITCTWFLFLVVSSMIAHSFLAYFVGSENLWLMMQKAPGENWNYFLIVTVMTLFVLFDFGWFREQFCIIMCPYGRIQSVLLDASSLSIVYDSKRGEPRRGLAKPNQPAGDCVSCNRCVQVCPTGIDIRKGLQMECISCTACADACDEIMVKTKKPRGLIRYDSLDGTKFQLLKPRAVIYMLLIGLLVFGLCYTLATREQAQVFVMRGQEAPFSFVKDETGAEKILNHFKLQIQNQKFDMARYAFKLGDAAPGVQLIAAQNPISAGGGEMITWHFFVRFEPEFLPARGQRPITLEITDLNRGEKVLKTELILVGPAHGF